jgi:hypothetical protein
MEIKFEIPQMVKANNPKPIVMEVKTKEIVETQNNNQLLNGNSLKPLPKDIFVKQENKEIEK